MEMETFDLVVVGAGIFGLALAKTFHQINPEASLLVINAADTLGGTWAKHRLWPGLKTNNLLGTFEYPDFPMEPASFGVQPGRHVPGAVIHEYLTQYAERFGVLDKIRYGTKVVVAEHQGGLKGGWILTTTGSGHGGSARPDKVFARKAVFATGNTCKRFMPVFEGQEEFGAPLFHAKDFPKYAHTLDSATSVTVLGGAKSAWDMVYQHASRGVKVDWVIRASGRGPFWMAPPYVTPLKKWLEELAHTRFLTWFSPCIWGDADGYGVVRRLLHGTWLGRAVTNAFWWVLGNDVLSLNGYDAHPETAKLKPWAAALFAGSGFSILNYSTDFFRLIRESGNVRVHIADVAHLRERTVCLADGTHLATDALCCATGWDYRPPIRFLPEGIESELGIPRVPDTNEAVFSARNLEKADLEILARFPRLRDQPTPPTAQSPPSSVQTSASTVDANSPYSPALTPFSLHRFMVPPSPRFLGPRDTAFAGALLTISTTTVAHVQAVWLCAYLYPDSSAPHTPLDDATTTAATGDDENLARLRYETALHARFGRWRCPAGAGARLPDFIFDAMPYFDLLLGDLGLKTRRKEGWWRELVEPYGPADYRDLVAEWQTKVAEGTGGKHI